MLVVSSRKKIMYICALPATERVRATIGDFRRILVFCLAWSFLGGAAVSAAAAQPNIILILADDLGYGDIGAYGATLIKTPHIDRLAEEGVRFTDFYASSNVCTPSRAGLLTGRYAVRDGLADRTVTVNDTRGLPPGSTTMASLLQNHGYRTGLFGKWHLGHHTNDQLPNFHGFDEFYGLLHPNDDEQPLYRNTRRSTEPLVQGALTRRFTEEAERFIDTSNEQPFFLYMSHTAPHIPLVPSPAFANTSEAGAYGDVVQELDWSVGRLLDALERNGIAGNTVIVFTSDNGPFPEGSAGGLRGGKATAWDGGYRVPFIARWPGRIPAGSASNAMAMNIDLLPTFAAIVGAPVPPSHVVDGRNILPLLSGDLQESPHEALYFFNHDRIAAVRTQDWRIVVRADYRNIERHLPDHNVLLLFDMRKDPEERYSMAAHQPEKWQKLLALFERGQRELESPANDRSP